MSKIHQFIGRIKLQIRGKNHVAGWSMTANEAIFFIKSLGKTVLTFYGYSGLGYEDEEEMLNIAGKILSEHSPQNTLVNIGVTSVGCGAIYPLAKFMGFETTGIVTTLALEYRGGISESVDHICFIKDTQWGGRLPHSDKLSPTSIAMVECSDILIGIGGGGICDDELLYGRELGKPIQFFPAEMNHEIASRYYKGLGLSPPEGFRFISRFDPK